MPSWWPKERSAGSAAATTAPRTWPPPTSLAEQRSWPGYRCVQQRHSYLRPRPDADFGIQKHADEELLSYVARRPELLLLAYSPLLGGAYCRPDRPLSEKYRWPVVQAQLAALAEVAKETGATVNQVVLAWLLGHPVPTIPVVGASSVAQLDESLAALDLVLDEDQRRGWTPRPDRGVRLEPAARRQS